MIYKDSKDIRRQKRKRMYPKSQVTAREGGVLKVPLAKIGKWYHKAYGVVEFTREDFSSIVSNYRDGLLGHKPYLTFGHLQEEFSIDSHKKKGDMIGFAEENDTLYGLFKASEDAYQSVREGEYEFSSGEFIRNFQDKNTGDSRGTLFFRVALTNSPFIPNLDKVQAFSIGEKETNSEVFTMKIDMNTNENSSTSEDIVLNPDTEVNKDTVLNPDTEVKEEVLEEMPTKGREGADRIEEEKEEELSISKEDAEESERESPQNEGISPISIKEEEVQVEEKKTNISNEEKKMSTTPESLSQTTQLNIENLIGDISNKLEKKYERTIGELTSLVKDLQVQLTAKQQDLERVKSITQAQALSLSQAQRQVLTAQEKVTADYLMGEGVSPALIQRFSQIREAIISNSSIVKLSTSEGEEKETSIIQALSDLLVDATNTPAVNFNQEGNSYLRKYDNNGLFSVAEATIRRNQELAKSLAKK